MRRLGRVAVLLVACSIILCGLWPYSTAGAQNPNVPSGTILIGQIKLVTGNEFVSLYNNTASDIDMSTVQLSYYNYYDLTNVAKLTSSKFIPLSGKLASHNYYMVSEGSLLICYKMTVNTNTLGFSTTAGTLQITQNGPANILDSVSWFKTSSTPPANVQAVPSVSNGFLQRAWVDGVPKTAGDAWVSVSPLTNDSCDLQTQIAASSTPALPPVSAAPQPVTVVTPTTSVSTAVTNNTGLVSPEITELLPNPAAPESDAADEFVELYNPNSSVFNMTGYRLESGTTYSHGYTFPSGNLLPKAYTAFLITQTGLQLSNSEGRARLLAPDSTVLSETPGYISAPEGSAWGVIADSWQWLDTPSPNAANIPNQSDTTTATVASSSANKTTSKTPKTTTTKKSTGTVKAASTTTPSTSNPNNLNDAAPLHPAILAGVGLAAVAYAIYEYRKDVANRVFQLRRYLRNRRAARTEV